MMDLAPVWWVLGGMVAVLLAVLVLMMLLDRGADR